MDNAGAGTASIHLALFMALGMQLSTWLPGASALSQAVVTVADMAFGTFKFMMISQGLRMAVHVMHVLRCTEVFFGTP